MAFSLKQTRSQRLRVSQRLSVSEGDTTETMISFSRMTVKTCEKYLQSNKGWDPRDRRKTLLRLKSLFVHFAEQTFDHYPESVTFETDASVIERLITQRFNDYLREGRSNRFHGFKSNLWVLINYFDQKIQKFDRESQPS